MKLPGKDLMDTLSLTRERVRVWVSGPLVRYTSALAQKESLDPWRF
jgi:hypothetical protein